MSLESLDTSFSAIVDRLLSNLGPGLDTNTGSMARTLAESYAREMATFYAMLELAHRSGYLDTAEGDALDNVVAVLGIDRARAGRLTGEVEFSRNSPAPDDIGIPAGRLVTGLPSDSTPLPLFETLEDATLRRGEMRVTVRVQQVQDDTKDAKKAPPVIDPGKLIVMPRPVLGIEAVTNRTPIRRTGEDETDESFRARARTALRDGEKGTLEAIASAVRQQGVQRVTVREPPDAPAGVVDVLVGDPDFSQDAGGVQRVWEAIRGTKAAGIQVRLQYARTIYFQVELQVEPADPDLDEAAFDRLRRELQQSLSRFAQGLPAGETVRRRKLEAVLYANPAVRHIDGLRVLTYVWGVDRDDPQKSALVLEAKSREYGPDRDWRLDNLETVAIDLEKKPPLISRLLPSIYRIDLVVSARRTDPRTPEQIRQALRGAVEQYAARLAKEAQATNKPQAILWEDLQMTLKQQAEVEQLLSAVVTPDDGLAQVLAQSSGKQEALTLEQGTRMELGGAEMVGLG
ncbi:baseplate J/gp47 family protein [Archangium lipolyticum]|uniref:baseplate J/gp47 family protein n=1 Tax=Archangium lipolyticum TaxID=2970465 RepID=UPI002149A223|nr:baseplate J/gp47 family protein [Archangium lipolyticum]